MTTPADLLRGITAPITVKALQAAADALDQAPELRTRIAGLEADNAALRARIAELEADDGKMHTVVAGDTLWSLARRYGETVATLKAWNRLTSDTITVGQRLHVTEPEAPAPILWGSNVWLLPGETYGQALTRTEAALGRLDVVRYFYGGAPSWPTDRTGDRLLHVSFKFSPDDVNTGRHDSTFREWCAAAPDRPTWWTFQHEADAKISRGEYTADAFRSAWRRLAAIAKGSGKDLRATLVLTGWTLEPESGRDWRTYYPGADSVDVLAWDPYHSWPHTDPAKVYAAARRVAVETGKPWAVAETGVKHDAPNRAATLAALARDLATVAPRPVFVTYFDADLPGDNEPDWMISTRPADAAAWVARRK